MPRSPILRGLVLLVSLHLSACAGRPATMPSAPGSSREVAAAFLHAARAGDEARAAALFDFESKVWMEQGMIAASLMASRQFDLIERLPHVIGEQLSPPQREVVQQEQTRRLMKLLVNGKCELSPPEVRVASRWKPAEDAGAREAQEAMWSADWLATVDVIDFIGLRCAEAVALNPDAEFSMVDDLAAIAVIRRKGESTLRVLDVAAKEVPTSLALVLEPLNPDREALARLAELIQAAPSSPIPPPSGEGTPPTDTY